MILSALAPFASLALAAALEELPPQIGEVAPPFGPVTWYLPDDAEPVAPDLASMRGSAVVAHSYGHMCDTCLRVAIPMLVQLRSAHDAERLHVVSFTVDQIDDDEDLWYSVAEERGVVHPIATTGGWFGENCPYLNLNEQPSLTYTWVIGKTGGVVWCGDPSSKPEAFLEAVRAALHGVDAPPLAAAYPDELADAVALYVAEDFVRAASVARKVASTLERKRDTEGAALANELADGVDALRAERIAALQSALATRDAEAFARAAHDVVRAFPKSDEANKELNRLRKEAKDDEPLLEAIEAWEAWLELSAERPALFPVNDDKEGKRFARSLEDYLDDHPDGPGAAQATEWLGGWAARG